MKIVMCSRTAWPHVECVISALVSKYTVILDLLYIMNSIPANFEP